MAKQRDVDAPLVPTSPLMRTAIAVVGGVVSGVSYPLKPLITDSIFFRMESAYCTYYMAYTVIRNHLKIYYLDYLSGMLEN